METESMGDALRRLLAENLKLQQKVFELEGKLRQYAEAADRDSTRFLNIRKLIQQKDQTLEQRAAELEVKQAQLEETVRQLEKRNEQLQLWMATLKLYQDLFEQDPEALLALNREGRVLLYNRKAEEMTGGKIREAIYRPIEEMDCGAFDPALPGLVREVLSTGRPCERIATAGGRRIVLRVLPVGSGAAFRGVLVRVDVAPAS